MPDSTMHHRHFSFRFWPSRQRQSPLAMAIATVSGLVSSALVGWVAPAAALEPAVTAPAELTELLSQIDAAASARNVDDVMDFFSSDFSHADGLTYDAYEAALNSFWERYTDISYSSELTGWEQDGDDLIAETLTTITGTESVGPRSAQLNAEIASRQVIRDGQVIEQETLTENNQITLGPTPPTLNINLPERVEVGQQFSFDAIVQEPLGDRILLGAAIEEAIAPEGYTETSVIDLDLLAAGGIFKIGQAPAALEDQWISALVVREDGITAITRRLQVVSDLDD